MNEKDRRYYEDQNHIKQKGRQSTVLEIDDTEVVVPGASR